MNRTANRLVLLTTFAVGVALFAFIQPQPDTPSSFEVRSPPEPTIVRAGTPLAPNCGILFLTIDRNGGITLNESEDLGTVRNTSESARVLSDIFSVRVQNRAYAPSIEVRANLPDEERIQKIVFVRAHSSLDYGDVLRVVDAVKGAGANPIVLQITDMNGRHNFHENLIVGNPELIKPLLLVEADAR